MKKLFLLAQVQVMTLAVDNPYLSKVLSMLADVKGWLLGLVAAVTAGVVAYHGLKYQGGDGTEKAQEIKNIKSKVIMGGGIFFLVWLGTYVCGQMA